MRCFLQRTKALSLWRDIVRGCKKISDPSTRAETLRFSKEEFVRNKSVKDIVRLLFRRQERDGAVLADASRGSDGNYG
ncbi:hypothetical protein IFR05_007344 [Cadophora sp. M221]|nr:hypothetical protein IFR05_007344 [Cadophora sp. M221]